MISVTPKVKDLVCEQAHFTHFEDGELWYNILWTECKDNGSIIQIHQFNFPVPAADAEGGRFSSNDRGIFFMRWIRKHVEYLERQATEGVRLKAQWDARPELREPTPGAGAVINESGERQRRNPAEWEAAFSNSQFGSAISCEHANEVAAQHPCTTCSMYCYCRSPYGTCAP